VAHDFNNLLAIIQGNLELAREDLNGNETALAHLKTALRAAPRGAELTHRLLAFSRKQTLSPVTVDLNERIAGVVDMLQRLLGESVDIVVETEPGLWPCDIDPAQLEVSLVNLGINARDAMPDGGILTIRSANVRGPGDGAGNGAKSGGDFVSLSVCDTGVGIEKPVLDKVFDPFFTTKGVGKGTGLGLSMVYGFIKQSGGNVTIDSRPGSGTTVTLLLPRSKSLSEVPADSDDAEVAGARGERIMVIEDDDDVRDLAMTQLGSLGYRAIEACDGTTALQRIEDFQDIDLVLTDLSLPGGLNGQQVAGELVKKHPHLRVLYMSGYSADDVTPNGTPVGDLVDNTLLIQKPFNRNDLARMLRVALDAN
jgi:CheY-like chemotaxis protein